MPAPPPPVASGTRQHHSDMSAVWQLVRLLKVLLAVLPIFTAESRHARMCTSQLTLWNNSLTLSDPDYWTTVWLLLSSVCLCLEAARHLRSSLQWKRQPTKWWSPYRGAALFEALRLSHQRWFTLLLLLWLLRLLQHTSNLAVCTYTLPLCGTVLAVCEFIMTAARSKQSVYVS